ncbi:MAG TPA: DUF2059 domain-containing protein [Anaeromyxobacteraceae bacterium]|nr:DUF2059 domain-containing protein [Anaeromyxobacteraceae bacterium]
MTAILVPLLAALAAAPPPAEAPPSPEAVVVARASLPRAVWDEVRGPALKQGRAAIAAKLLEGHIAAPQPMLDEITALPADALSYDAVIEILARSLGGIYTPAELEGLAAFYRSDLGRRLVETSPLLQRRIGEEVGAFMQARMVDVQPQLAQIIKRYVSPKD